MSDTLADVLTFAGVRVDATDFAAFLTIQVLEGAWLAQLAILFLHHALNWVEEARFAFFWCMGTLWAVVTLRAQVAIVILFISWPVGICFAQADITSWADFTTL